VRALLAREPLLEELERAFPRGSFLFPPSKNDPRIVQLRRRALQVASYQTPGCCVLPL
jgi:hypothetical protein